MKRYPFTQATEEQVEQTIREGGSIVFLNSQFAAYLLFDKNHKIVGKVSYSIIQRIDLKQDFDKHYNGFDNPTYTPKDKDRSIWVR